MTEQKKKMLKAKIAAALYHENGKVPTPEEIDKWTKFAQVLYTQNRHPMFTTPVKSACNAVIVISLRW
jgi:hypothetical protein